MTRATAPERIPEDDEGPCWVVLGGSESIRGIYLEERPANIALGRFPSLLPIVVACPTYGDARHINEVNALFEQHGIERNNYTALKTLFLTSTEIWELLTGYKRWYAIRVGKETGIWVGYHWDTFKANKETKDAEFKGHDTIRDALLYMIEKAPFNQPPKTPKSARSSPVKAPPRAPAGSSSRPAAAPSSAAPPSADSVRELLASFSQHTLGRSPSLDVLRAVIQPLASQVPAAAGRAAFALGPRADAFLRGRRANTEDLLKILRARLYTTSAVDFAHYISVELEWEQSEGEELWDMIELPGL